MAAIQALATEAARHVHNRERWRGVRVPQTATEWAADGLTAFQAISGAGAYGADPGDEAQVLGSADTPLIAGKTTFDLRQLFITDLSVATPYKLRLAWGTTTLADALAAGQFTEQIVAEFGGGPFASGGPIDVLTPRLAAGTQVWAQAWNATDNATIDFLVGVHEY
jgi:hypothetical protein